MKARKCNPGRYCARNLNPAGRRIHFASPRSRLGAGGVNRTMRELLAIIAEGVGRGEEA